MQLCLLRFDDVDFKFTGPDHKSIILSYLVDCETKLPWNDYFL